MGFFDDVNGPASAPVVKLEAEEMVRLRIITAPEDTKYGKAKKFWQHSCPNEQTHLFGGFCSIMCIGDRNGCIFHEEPFKWSCTSKIPINVIEYEMDKQQRLTGARSVKLWVIGNRVYDSIVSQFAINCIPIENLGERDFIVRRAGTKQATSYTVNIAPSNVELQIDWNFPEIPNGFGDETYPFLVDFGKVYGFQEMTPIEQRKWLDGRMERGRSRANEADPTNPQAAFFAQNPTNVPAFWNSSGPTNSYILGVPMTQPNVAHIEGQPDPWGLGKTMGQLTPSELQYIVDTPGHSHDHISSAKTLLAKPAVPPAPPVAAAPLAPPPGPTAPPGTPNLTPPPAQHTAAFPQPAPFTPAAAAPVQQSFMPQAHHAASFPAPVTTSSTALPMPAPGAAAPPITQLPPSSVPVNPLRVQVETRLQAYALFQDFQNVKRFLGAWQVKMLAVATDQQLQQMLQVLSYTPDQLAAWVGQFPIPDWQ